MESDQSTSRATRRWWARPLLLLASILFALIVGELAIRLTGLAPTPIPIDLEASKSVYQRSANPIMGYELKPNYSDRLADTHQSLPKTNSDGQRDIERAIERRPGVPRVILLGDSVVAGHGIEHFGGQAAGVHGGQSHPLGRGLVPEGYLRPRARSVSA